jgi:hypothetical protein
MDNVNEDSTRFNSQGKILSERVYLICTHYTLALCSGLHDAVSMQRVTLCVFTWFTMEFYVFRFASEHLPNNQSSMSVLSLSKTTINVTELRFVVTCSMAIMPKDALSSLLRPDKSCILVYN